MVKHIGIIACSAEGAALCYRKICQFGLKTLGEYNHPEISMHTPPLKNYIHKITKDDWEGVAGIMLASIKKLEQNGAEFAICPDNTIHQAFEYLENKSPIPVLHIAKEVAKEAKDKGFNKLGILGTKYLMEGPVYSEILNEMNISYLLPEKEDIYKINHIIFDELVHGKINEVSKAYFQEIIEKMKENGCDAVILGCTEIPLIINAVDSSLPVLDSTDLLAKAALNYALNKNT